MEIGKDFAKLRELLLLEEFKKCLPNEIKTYLEEQKTNTLQQAAVRSDDYSLMHKTSFAKTFPQPGDKKPSDTSNPKSRGLSHDQRPRFPSGPTCYYCKKKGHVMAECHALERKNQRQPKPGLLVKQVPANVKLPNPQLANHVAKSYAPFLSQGSVSLVGQSSGAPITMLRDTGAMQTLLLENVLPFQRGRLLVVVYSFKELVLEQCKCHFTEWSYLQI